MLSQKLEERFKDKSMLLGLLLTLTLIGTLASVLALESVFYSEEQL